MLTKAADLQDERWSTSSKVKVATGLVWLTPALWAVNFVVARTAPGLVGPYTLALGRWGIAGAILLAITYKELWENRRYLADTWHQQLFLGFLGMLVCGAWVYLGARTTGTMNMSLIYAASPVLISLGAVLWLGEQFNLRQATGVLFALAGVLHVIAKGQWFDLRSINWIVGDLWLVLAMLAWALYSILQKVWTSPLSAIGRIAVICIGGVLTLVPCSVWELRSTNTPSLGIDAFELMLVAAIFPGVLAYWIHSWSQKILGASRVAVTLYLNPLYAALVAWAVLDEPLGLHHFVGGCLVLFGVFIVTMRRERT